jgi:hypothetical protein
VLDEEFESVRGRATFAAVRVRRNVEFGQFQMARRDSRLCKALNSNAGAVRPRVQRGHNPTRAAATLVKHASEARRMRDARIKFGRQVVVRVLLLRRDLDERRSRGRGGRLVDCIFCFGLGRGSRGGSGRASQKRDDILECFPFERGILACDPALRARIDLHNSQLGRHELSSDRGDQQHCDRRENPEERRHEGVGVAVK